MNVKVLRSVHLYLGCFFTPVLVFFLLTGLMQTFEWHEKKKNGDAAPAVLSSLAQVHKHQRYSTEGFKPKASVAFQIFLVLMTVGLLVNLVFGIILAFKFAHTQVVWVSMALGVVIPVLMLWIPWFQR